MVQLVLKQPWLADRVASLKGLVSGERHLHPGLQDSILNEMPLKITYFINHYQLIILLIIIYYSSRDVLDHINLYGFLFLLVNYSCGILSSAANFTTAKPKSLVQQIYIISLARK